MKSKLAPVLLLAALVAALVLIASKHAFPDGIALKGFDPQAIAGILTWLFTVALFIERAVEVIVMVLRDADADQLEANVATAQATLDEKKKLDPSSPDTSVELSGAQAALADYRGTTKQIALSIGLILGILVSLAGVRALGAIVVAPSDHGLYTTVDVFITGAVLAGGSEGVHQMANVITNFLQTLADKAKK